MLMKTNNELRHQAGPLVTEPADALGAANPTPRQMYAPYVMAGS